MLSRRTFIKQTPTGGIGLFLWAGSDGRVQLLAQVLPGGTLRSRRAMRWGST